MDESSPEDDALLRRAMEILWDSIEVPPEFERSALARLHLVHQGFRLFNLGIGPEVGKRLGQEMWSVEAYLSTLPKPCGECCAEASASREGPTVDRFWYFLVEPRAGLVFPSEAAGIVSCDSDTAFVSWDKVPIEEPYWALFHSGEAHLGKLTHNARVEIVRAKDIPASAIDGICARIHYPDVVTELHNKRAGRAMDLIGSVHSENPMLSACLSVWDGRAHLGRRFGTHGIPQYGAAFRRECRHAPR